MSNAHLEQYIIPISFFNSKTATGKNPKTGRPDFYDGLNQEITWPDVVALLAGYSQVQVDVKESSFLAVGRGFMETVFGLIPRRTSPLSL